MCSLPGIAEAKILLCGLQEPEAIAAHYLAAGAKLVVVKLGGKGAYYARKGRGRVCARLYRKESGGHRGRGRWLCRGPAFRPDGGPALQSAVLRGNAIGAIQVMSRGDNDGLPTRARSWTPIWKEEEHHA